MAVDDIGPQFSQRSQKLRPIGGCHADPRNGTDPLTGMLSWASASATAFLKANRSSTSGIWRRRTPGRTDDVPTVHKGLCPTALIPNSQPGYQLQASRQRIQLTFQI